MNDFADKVAERMTSGAPTPSLLERANRVERAGRDSNAALPTLHDKLTAVERALVEKLQQVSEQIVALTTQLKRLEERIGSG